jgi:murein DD-endopeptidase MepM/ murein hydrolase activator NlpD
MKIWMLLALSQQTIPQLAPMRDGRTVARTLAKLESLGDRLSKKGASVNDLGQAERALVATLDELKVALDEALAARRLITRRIAETKGQRQKLRAGLHALEAKVLAAQKLARSGFGLLLRRNHAGRDKPLLRAFERQRVQRAVQLFDAATRGAKNLDKQTAELDALRDEQTKLRAALDSLLAERKRVRGLAAARLATVRADRGRAQAHAKALEQQRLTLAAWLNRLKPALIRASASGGLRRGRLVPPVAGKLLNGYGWQEAADQLSRWRNRGVDLGGVPASPVVAAASGKIAFVGRSPGLGLAVVLDHGGGWRTVYGGLSEAEVQTGDILKTGDILGLLGDSGRLHFELRSAALAVNPEGWFHDRLQR